MKMAAAKALAELTQKPVPDDVKKAFPADKDFTFGPNYIVPTPFDPRLLKGIVNYVLIPSYCTIRVDTPFLTHFWVLQDCFTKGNMPLKECQSDFVTIP